MTDLGVESVQEHSSRLVTFRDVLASSSGQGRGILGVSEKFLADNPILFLFIESKV